MQNFALIAALLNGKLQSLKLSSALNFPTSSLTSWICLIHYQFSCLHDSSTFVFRKTTLAAEKFDAFSSRRSPTDTTIAIATVENLKTTQNVPTTLLIEKVSTLFGSQYFAHTLRQTLHYSARLKRTKIDTNSLICYLHTHPMASSVVWNGFRRHSLRVKHALSCWCTITTIYQRRGLSASQRCTTVYVGLLFTERARKSRCGNPQGRWRLRW